MWYSHAYRRHLCDMHIADWDESFLRDFSPEKYVENLKAAKIQNAMIYFQSHVGLCFYPTECGVMHKALTGREDLMKRTVELCYKNGISVTGYYSLNFNTLEHDRHPAWRMLMENGKSWRENGFDVMPTSDMDPMTQKSGRYGLCCPNNMEYRQFVYRQIDEMLSYFKVDGLFFDMPFWQHTCYCDNCRARWKKEVGTPFPKGEVKHGSELHLTLMRKKYEWMGEWSQAVFDYVKSINKNISVEQNFAAGISDDSNNGCGEEVNSACDFVGGDLYGGMLNHSLACKFYKNITKNQPFEYMFSRCKPGLRSHTLTKSVDEMTAEVMMTAAHHGATLVIDAIDPVGTQDERVYERVGQVFDKQIPYEEYFVGDMVEDVGLYYSIKSRFSDDGGIINNKDGCIGASKAMISNHIPFGVTGSFYGLDEYRVIVIPMLSAQDDDTERILDYIERGGKVYFSGAKNTKLCEKLMKARFLGYTDEKNVYIAPEKEFKSLFGWFNEKYPLPFETHAPILSGVGNGKVVAKCTLPYTRPQESKFASIHSDPPGRATQLPAMVEGSYGKGHFFWSAMPIEAIDYDEYRKIFLNSIHRLLDGESMSFLSTAPDNVEITLFEDDECFYINTIQLDERSVMPDVPSFNIKIRCTENVKRVELLPSKREMLFEKKGEYISFDTLPMHVFSMYRIIK